MSLIERLQQEHDVVRTELDALDAVLELGDPSPQQLHTIGATLATCLDWHVSQERRAIAFARGRCREFGISERLLTSHYYGLQCIYALNRQWTAGRSSDEILPTASEFSSGLRRHLEDQEAEVFPLLVRLTLVQGQPAPADVPAAWLNHDMTLQQTTALYPAVHPVFERLGVSCETEGSESLEEVAWRHGLESHELLSQLADAITGRQDAKSGGLPREASLGRDPRP